MNLAGCSTDLRRRSLESSSLRSREEPARSEILAAAGRKKRDMLFETSACETLERKC